MEKTACGSQFLGGGGYATPGRAAQGQGRWSGGRGSGGKCGEEPLFCGFCRKEWVRQGNQV